jgi:hypothetical protein
VVRRAQLAVGRRGRGRVEDGFVVLIDGKTATPTIPRAAAMKQARWATILVGGEFIPIYETMTGRQLARRRRAKRRDRPATLSEWRRWLGSPYRKHGARIGPDRRVVRT